MSRQTALRFINIAHFFDHYFLLIFPTAALAIAPAWGMTYAQTLALGTPLYLMFGLATLPAGWLGDRIDRMTLMVVFYLGCGCSGLLIALSTGPVMLSAGLGLLGVFAAIYHPVGIVLVTQIGTRTGRALAVNGVFGNLGLAGAAVMTGLLADQAGWRSAFAVPGVVAILIGFALFVLDRRARRQPASAPEVTEPRPIVASRRTQITVFLVVCVAALFSGLIFNALTVSLPKFLEERLVAAGGDLGRIGASAGLVFAVAAFAQLPVGEMLDRMGARPILCALLTAQCALLAALSQAAGWMALVISLLLVTSLFAAIPITSWLLGHYVRSGLRSRAVSVEYVLSLGIGSAVVPLIAFMHARHLGFDIQFLLLAACAAIVLTAAIFLPGRASSVGDAISVSANRGYGSGET